MELQKTPNSQSNLEKQRQSWRHHNSKLQVILQSCQDQDNMLPAQKQTYRSIEQSRKPRNEPTTIWSTNLRQSRKEYPVGKKAVSSTNGVGKTGQQHAKEFLQVSVYMVVSPEEHKLLGAPGWLSQLSV